MFGDTLTINNGGSGGSPAVMNKINQDNYGAEYMTRSSVAEWRLKIRHAKENVKGGSGQERERHVVELNLKNFATDTDPETNRSIVVTLRHDVGDTPATISDVYEGLSEWMTEANFLKLLGWES